MIDHPSTPPGPPSERAVQTMYESFFECRQRPFLAAPQTDRYYPGRTIEAARVAVERCLDRAEGIAILVGPSGTGKTLLSKRTAERFRDQFAVVSLAAGGLSTRRNFYQAVSYELNLPYRNLEEGELRLAIIDRLTDAQSSGMVLLVDDAHSLPPRLLEEVRVLADVARAGQPRVRILLVGASSLEDRFAMPRLSPLEQRVTTRCYLEAFDRNDTLGYLRSQIVAVGGDPTRIFTDAALDAVYRATDGIPRLINQTCDHALVLAFAGGVKPIDVAGIEEAWADLQQLPTPWSREKGFAGSQDLPAVSSRGTANPVYMQHASAPRSPAEQFDRTTNPVVDLGTATQNLMNQIEPMTTPVPPSSEVIEFVTSLPDSIPAAVDATLEVIETQLSDWEREFTPPAKREPEVELVVERRPNDPFCEDFVEEEIVADRYVDQTRIQTAARVSAFTPDARILSTLLDVQRDLSQRDTADLPKLRVVESTTVPAEESTESSAEVVSVSSVLNNEPEAVSAEYELAMVQERGPTIRSTSPIRELSSRPAARVVESPSAEGTRTTATPHARFEKQVDPVEPEDLIIVARRSSGDADMIILEDDPVMPGAPTPEATVVRKQDYRHMFARLRRGT